MRRIGRTACWLAALVAAGVALRIAGTGQLAPPPLAPSGGVLDWVEAREPIAAAIALVRLAAELAVWYVLAVSTLHVAAGTLRLTGAHRLADALALPAVARLVRAGLGAGVVAASALSPAESAAPPASGTAAMVPSSGIAVATPTGTATMRPAPQPHASPSGDVARMAPLTTWTVEAGDSFWSIAEEVLADAWGRPPADAEVDPFWRALIERNRPRLVDPDDPDLLHPGQVLELPPLP